MDKQKQREMFESVTELYHCIYNADLNYYFSGSKLVPDDAERIVNAGWRAWQQAQKVAMPDTKVVIIALEKVQSEVSCSSFMTMDEENEREIYAVDAGKLSRYIEAMIEAQENST